MSCINNSKSYWKGRAHQLSFSFDLRTHKLILSGKKRKKKVLDSQQLLWDFHAPQAKWTELVENLHLDINTYKINLKKYMLNKTEAYQ
jgi:hypothetical protein